MNSVTFFYAILGIAALVAIICIVAIINKD